jgi:hypothetical protein
MHAGVTPSKGVNLFNGTPQGKILFQHECRAKTSGNPVVLCCWLYRTVKSRMGVIYILCRFPAASAAPSVSQQSGQLPLLHDPNVLKPASTSFCTDASAHAVRLPLYLGRDVVVVVVVVGGG